MNWKIFLLGLLIIISYHTNIAINQSPEDELEKNGEKFNFQADVSRLMDIIINSLYKNKEVFLRELISNGSDALDKIRYLSIQNPEILKSQKDLKIMIEFNTTEKSVSVIDTGIGMTRDDLIKHLGTVAKSGTAQFVEALSKGDTFNLIGRFGVGFYSCYLVAKKVVVYSKHNDDAQHIWVSQAGSKFTVIKDPAGNTLIRGTRVKLFLKEEAAEFLEQNTLRQIVQKYSEFINYPIYLYISKETSKQVEEEVPINENETSNATSKPGGEKEKLDNQTKSKENKSETNETLKEEKIAQEKNDSDEIEVSEEEKKPKFKKQNKTVYETTWEWQHVNENKAIWLKNKKEVKEEEYNKFYKSITNDFENPIAHTHIHAEGEVDFKALLYIPKNAPSELYENYYGKATNIKLYISRVLITDNFEDLLPKYLNFVKGVLDSNDLNINVNREQLQEYKVVRIISKKLVTNIIDLLTKLSNNETDVAFEDDDDENTTASNNTKIPPKREEDKYKKFWKEFAKNMKLGLVEDPGNKQKIAKLLRFYSTKSMTEITSFDDYIKRKKEKQDVIYFLPGDNKDNLYKSPLLQKLKEHDVEVLLFDDPMDEYSLSHLEEYEKLKLQNVAKGDVKTFDDEEEEERKIKKLNEYYKPLLSWWKSHLGSQVINVTVGKRLTKSPCIIYTSESGASANMERISKQQAFVNPNRGHSQMTARKYLEINPSHPTIKKLLEIIIRNDTTEMIRATETADTIFNTALVNSGFTLDEPTIYFEKIDKLIRKSFKIKLDEPVDEIEVNLDDEDDVKPTNKSKSKKKKDKKKDEDEDDEDVSDLEDNTPSNNSGANQEVKKEQANTEEKIGQTKDKPDSTKTETHSATKDEKEVKSTHDEKGSKKGNTKYEEEL